MHKIFSYLIFLGLMVNFGVKKVGASTSDTPHFVNPADVRDKPAEFDSQKAALQVSFAENENLFKEGGNFAFGSYALMGHSKAVWLSLYQFLHRHYGPGMDHRIALKNAFLKRPGTPFEAWYRDSDTEKEIHAILFAPPNFEKTKKYPVIFYVPGTSGKGKTEEEIAKRLATERKCYVVLADSNVDLHGNSANGKMMMNQMVFHVFEPLIWVNRLAGGIFYHHPNMDPENFHIIGVSRGGITARYAGDSTIAQAASVNQAFKFTSTVALSSPNIFIPAKSDLTTPTLLLAGEKDDFCPSRFNAYDAQILQSQGQPCVFSLIEGAGHSCESLEYTDEDGNLRVPEKWQKNVKIEGGRISIPAAHTPRYCTIGVEGFEAFAQEKDLSAFETNLGMDELIQEVNRLFGSLFFMEDFWDQDKKAWKPGVQEVHKPGFLAPESKSAEKEPFHRRVYSYFDAFMARRGNQVYGAHLDPDPTGKGEEMMQVILSWLSLHFAIADKAEELFTEKTYGKAAPVSVKHDLKLAIYMATEENQKCVGFSQEKLPEELIDRALRLQKVYLDVWRKRGIRKETSEDEEALN